MSVLGRVYRSFKLKQLIIRSVVLIVIVAVLAATYYWLVSRPQDRPLMIIPPVDSKGYILALMETEDGQKVVSIAPDGKIRGRNVAENISDTSPIWSKTGEHIIYISNQTSDGSYQIFEWIPDRENEPFQLSPNGASRSSPWLTGDGKLLLYASQGDISGMTYPQRQTRKVMPPYRQSQSGRTEEGIVDTDSVRSDLVSQAWSNLSEQMRGESFENGFLDPEKNYFIGVYITARSKVLVIQNLKPNDAREATAVVPFGAEDIQIDVSTVSPIAVVSIVQYRDPIPEAIPPERIRPDGTVIYEFVNALFAINLREQQTIPLFAVPNSEQLLVSPAISPDGKQVAVVPVQRKADKIQTQGIAILPIKEGGAQEARLIVSGNVTDPSWMPDGSGLLFIRDGDVWQVNADGTGEKQITRNAGKFHHPQRSPMR
jgi:hypothetical protein